MKKRLKLFIVIFAFACLLFTCGCKNDPKPLSDPTKDNASRKESEFWDKYGGERAVVRSEKIDKNIVYNVYNLSNANQKLAKKAVNSVNESLKKYSNYTIGTTSTQGLGNRKMVEIQKFDDNPNAIAFFTFKDDSITIVKTNYNNLKGDDSKVHALLHELGHSIGLKDLYDSEVIGKSVMYGRVSKYTFTEFTKFDNANIDYLYDK